MRPPSEWNWTTQYGWLAIGALAAAPLVCGQEYPRHPTNELQRKERWVAGAPYPLTPFEQRMRSVQLEPMPSELRREPVTPGMVSVQELRNPISKRDLEFLARVQKELQTDRRESALRELEGALAKSQLAGHARAILGVDALRRGDFDAAVKALSDSALRLPNTASVRGHLGVALAASGRTGLAEEELRRAIELQPGLAIAQYTLGVMLLDQPLRHWEAAQSLHAAEVEIPQARMALAVLYAISGERERMRQALKTARASDAAQSEQWVLTASTLPQPSAAFGVRTRAAEPVTPPASAQKD